AAITLYAKWTLGNEQFFTFTVQTTAANQYFYIPVSGRLGSNSPPGYVYPPYDWNIDWGDGPAVERAAGNGGETAAGIGHAYEAAGTYRITITPAGEEDAWLGAFGFRSITEGANSQDNKNRVVSVDSPLRPLMTRTQAQIAEGTAPSYEWVYTFSDCQNDAFTMGEGFRFSDEWDSITTAGDSFAEAMFIYCSGADFAMNSVFNLPQKITTVGEGFAVNMFYGCFGDAFTMNGVFNLPQGITTAGDYFAYCMFYRCSGAGFLVNGVFKFPTLSSIPSGAFYQTFSLVFGAKAQDRTAASIINGNGTPDSDMNTFGPAAAWSDYDDIAANWQG
ncbi:MAG: hypothetical protein LBF78_00765, partial [Treponema sp.]|nr:hypothetical protein [Treponema sp.]